jgi:pyruvate/2-oxoglutarate/acetoin dehydrogenase E1 component
VPEGVYRIPLGKGRIMRRGKDVTVVALSYMCLEALRAAEVLAGEGIDAEVIDLRTLRPIDADTMFASVAKTNRLLVVEEGPRTGGWAGEVLALATEAALHDLDDAWRLTTADHPIPYSPTLEDSFLPLADAIVSGVRARLGVAASA